MENEKILGIIGDNYPFSLAESFFHEEVVELSKYFTRVIVFQTNIHLVFEKKTLFEVPKNVEIIELDTKTSLLCKLLAFFYLNPLELLKDFKLRKQKFNLFDKIKSIRTCIHYLAKSKKIHIELNQFIHLSAFAPSELILYTYWLNEFSLGINSLKRLLPQIRTFSRAHGWDLYEERHHPPFLPFRKKIITQLDGLFPISNHGKYYILKNYNITDSSNIHVAHLGSSAKNINSTRTDKLEILTIAFLSPVKNMEILISALSILDIPFHWTHIGNGSNEYSKQIKTLVENKISNSEHKVSFLGTLSSQAIKDYLENSEIDLLINTSFSEGIPVSMMEAISAGIPIIGPNVGGIPEIISEDCGFLLSKTPDENEIKNVLIKYYNLDVDTKLKIRKNAFLKWEKDYNSEKNYFLFSQKLKSLT